MMKAKMITGPRGSGKTVTARQIASEYESGEVSWITNIHKNRPILSDPFLFRHCNPETKLVIFDDLLTLEHVDEVIKLAAQGINVERPMKEPFVLITDIIAVCSDELDPIDFEKVNPLFFNIFSLIIK